MFLWPISAGHQAHQLTAQDQQEHGFPLVLFVRQARDDPRVGRDKGDYGAVLWIIRLSVSPDYGPAAICSEGAAAGFQGWKSERPAASPNQRWQVQLVASEQVPGDRMAG